MLVVKRKSSNKVAKLLGEAPPETKGSNKLSKFFGENLKKAPTPKAQIVKFLFYFYFYFLIFRVQYFLKLALIPFTGLQSKRNGI